MEEFKIIKDFEKYSVSNLGNVKINKTGQILKSCIANTGYKMVHLNKEIHLLHRLVGLAFIPNPENKPFIDHIDTDKLNNSLENLRWSTISENNCNKSIQSNNTSGITGISWNKRLKKWHSYIKIKSKNIHLGYFTDKEEAIRIRKLKANELFGEFCHKSEKIVNFNIKIPKNTKLNINVVVEDDLEELKLLEEEFLEKLK